MLGCLAELDGYRGAINAVIVIRKEEADINLVPLVERGYFVAVWLHT